ncbi:MAG: redox-sensing transcriptional repressor Rex [Clostridia bacterium]|nr:redox-sensing transcriptional repressor Rex [Clostridia bacterium]
MKPLPDKTIERLSMYRRNLIAVMNSSTEYLFSHQLAALMHTTPVQVRRDIMLIGYTGTMRKGYHIGNLVELIGIIIDSRDGKNVAVVGIGNLGKAIISHFNGKRSKLRIIAAFDSDPEKYGQLFAGVRTYPVSKINEIVRQQKICIGIIAVPEDKAEDVAEKLVCAGVTGILNYTSQPLSVPSHVYLEEYDMLTSIEKVAYHAKVL